LIMSPRILVICRQPEILATIVRLINSQPEWQGAGASSDEEATKIFLEKDCDIVLIGTGVNLESEQHLRQVFEKKNPAVKIIQHYGGGSGLLFGEIHQALTKD
jgi:hypothetical protein